MFEVKRKGITYIELRLKKEVGEENDRKDQGKENDDDNTNNYKD